MKLILFWLKFSIGLLIGFYTEFSFGQTENKILEDSLTDKSEFRVGIRYKSDYLYMGRSDSLKSPYFSPSLAYFHKSGFFIQGSLSYMVGGANSEKVDLYLLSAGYDYYANKYLLGVSLSQYLFNDNSYSVQSELKTYIDATAGYDFSVFALYLDASLGFSNGIDAFLGGEISRPFYMANNRLKIEPSVNFNLGSQKYYEAYYLTRNNHSAQNSAGGSHHATASQDVQIQESEKFKFLDIEAGVELAYKINKVRLFASSVWTFPFNPSTLIVDGNKFEEKLKNDFYWVAGVRLIIK